MKFSFKALFLDLSGVLYDGNKAITGAAQALRFARNQNLVLCFVTNTATQSKSAILEKLRKMSFKVNEEELFTAPFAAKNYILQHNLRPYCLIHDAIKNEFLDLDQNNPNCVLLGDAREDLHYDSLNHAFMLCNQGAQLIGIGMNKYFKDEDGLKLDAGGFIRAIEWAADTKAIIMGKPSTDFFQQVVASTSFQPNECMMVGDDVEADVIGAIETGLQGTLVKTGKFQSGDEVKLPKEAYIIDSINNIFDSIH